MKIFRGIAFLAATAIAVGVSAAPSDFTILLAEGDPAPYAGENLNITRLYFGDFNAPGQLAATVEVPRQDGSGGSEQFQVATEPDGGFRVVTRNGTPLAGTSLGAYEYSLFAHVYLNDQGEVAYQAYQGSVSTTWSEAGELHLVNGGRIRGFANDGDLLHSSWTIEENGVNQSIYCRDAVFAPDGSLIYSVRQTGPGITDLNDDIVYRRSEHGTEVLAQDGDRAWGMPDGFRFASIQLAFVYPKSHPVFSSSLVLPDGTIESGESLFADSKGNQRLVARHGAAAPGFEEGFVYDWFQEYYTTETGRAVVHAWVEDSNGGYEIGLFREDDNQLELLIRSGQSAQGLPGMTVNPELTFLYDSPITGASIANGDWYGNTIDEYGMALWSIDENDEWHLLLTSGDQLEVSPGDTRTISYIHAKGFSDAGVLFADVGFTDLTSAVISWTDVTQPVAGDANGDGIVNASDYVLWRNGVGQTVLGGYGADANVDRVVDQGDYNLWLSHFGQTTTVAANSLVPEPCVSSFLAVISLAAFAVDLKLRLRNNAAML